MDTGLENLKDWRFSIDAEHIAWAVFDQHKQKMNTLGRRPVEELGRILEVAEQAANLGDIVGLVFISGKSNNFIAGADIREFEQLQTEDQARQVVDSITSLFDRMEQLRVPVIAAINGYCLGGGLEFALACHYRIATRPDGTRLGFPEVKLGLLPGLHGTVRSVHTVGPINAMGLMLTGRMLRSGAAKAQGFVDQLVDSHHNLRWAARKAVLSKRKPRGLSLGQQLQLISPFRSVLASKMRKQTENRVRADHYPAPFSMIELFQQHGNSVKRMRKAETDAFAPLMVSETSRNLRRVFRLSELLKAQAGDKSFRPTRVHVIGAGLMGGDIAAWCVVSGFEVCLQDLNEEQIETARNRARKLFKKRLKKPLQVDAAMSRLLADPQGKHIPRADVVIEAVVEILDIKQKLLAEIEPQLKSGALLATNTSSLMIEDIAHRLQDRSRLVGLHFFNPVAKMPLVEVVAGKESDAVMLDRGAAFVAHIKKSPLKVVSAPGFLVNRVLAPYMMAAISRYQDGMKAEVIDQAALDFGMPMGPIELSDVVGLDTISHVGRILGISPPAGSMLDQLVKKGNLGKKTGRGFYEWHNGKPKKHRLNRSDWDMARLSEELSRPLIEESRQALRDQIVDSADLVDAGVIFGTGFAPFRGGPLKYEQSLKRVASPMLSQQQQEGED